MDQKDLRGFRRLLKVTTEPSESIDEGLLAELRNVDPLKLLYNWLNCIQSHPRSHGGIDKDVKELMILYEQEQAGKLSGPGAYRFQTLLNGLGILFRRDKYPPPVFDGRDHHNTIYCNQITIPNLRVMLPHFCNLPQLKTCTELSISRIYLILQNPEFGGVIPHGQNELLKNESRRKIELLHMYCLCRTDPLRSCAMHFKFYRLRNEKSLLDNSLRFRVLENYDIITSHGELTSRANEAFEEIKHWADSNSSVIFPKKEERKNQFFISTCLTIPILILLYYFFFANCKSLSRLQ